MAPVSNVKGVVHALGQHHAKAVQSQQNLAKGSIDHQNYNNCFCEMTLASMILLQIGIGALCTFVIWLLCVRILPKLARHSATSFDDFILKCFADLAVPLGVVVALTLIRDDLPLNQSLNSTYVNLVHFAIFVVAVRFVNRIAVRFMQGLVRRAEDELQVMYLSLMPLMRALVWVVGTLLYLQSLGMQLAAIWALLSAGGIGIGLALKDPAMELFAYFMILLDKPFRVGQFINIGPTWATVEKIGVRSTCLRSLRGEIVVMSNSSLIGSVISNFADMPRRRIIYTIGVTYDTSAEVMAKVPSLISSAVNRAEHAVFDRCHFVEFAQSSLNFEVVYFIDTKDYGVAMDSQQSINLYIMKLFEENGIDFAFPTQTIHIGSS